MQSQRKVLYTDAKRKQRRHISYMEPNGNNERLKVSSETLMNFFVSFVISSPLGCSHISLSIMFCLLFLYIGDLTFMS